MKLNIKLIFLILFSITFLTDYGAGIKPPKGPKTLNVIVLNTDTIFTNKIVSYHTRLKLGNKQIEITNNFNYDRKQDSDDIFNFKKYLGLEVSAKHSFIKHFGSFNKSLCNNASWKVFTVFKGDSIDNLEGFKYKYIAHNKTEYYILNGYFYGCNGSMCNSGAVLVLTFEKGLLSTGALFGVDKSTINLNTVSPRIKNNMLFLIIESEDNGRKKKIELSFGKDINLLSKGGLIDNGLNCIK